MKKIVSLLVAVLCLTTANACMKKTPLTVNHSPLTVIVMDTTQALVPFAQARCFSLVTAQSGPASAHCHPPSYLLAAGDTTYLQRDRRTLKIRAILFSETTYFSHQ